MIKVVNVCICNDRCASTFTIDVIKLLNVNPDF